MSSICKHILNLNVHAYSAIYDIFALEKCNYLSKGLKLCFNCDESTGGRHIFACLTCIHFACPKHLNSHLELKGHEIYILLSTGCILCLVCKEFLPKAAVDSLRKTITVKTTSEDAMLPKEQLEHSERVERISEKHFVVRGLVNLGNTCYMNSILQVLLHTSILREYFLKTIYEKCTQRSHCVECELIQFFHQYYGESTGHLKPKKIIRSIMEGDRRMAGYGQKDAHEFYVVLNDLLEEHLTERDFGTRLTSIVKNVFQGKIQSDLRCLTCSNVSSRIDPFWDISVEIPGPGSNLHDCLLSFTRPERLDSVKCGACNAYLESTKQLTFKELPNILVIHLKGVRMQNGQRKKEELQVSFPLDLEMSPYMTANMNSDGKNTFSLYAVVVHDGNSEAGHFYSYVKENNEWYMCSDDTVRQVSIEDTMNSQWYLLFYEKKKN